MPRFLSVTTKRFHAEELLKLDITGFQMPRLGCHGEKTHALILNQLDWRANRRFYWSMTTDPSRDAGLHQNSQSRIHQATVYVDIFSPAQRVEGIVRPLDATG